MKNKIIFVVALLVPILCSVFIGNYAINGRYNPGSNLENVEAVNTLKRKAYTNYMADARTLEDTIQNYANFIADKYIEEPIFVQDIKNDDNETLFSIAVYEALIYSMVEGEKVYNVSPLMFLYNVQYNTIKDTMVTEDREGVNAAEAPTISFKLISDSEQTFEITLKEDPFNSGTTQIIDTRSDHFNTQKGVLIGDIRAGIKSWKTENVEIEVTSTVFIGKTETSAGEEFPQKIKTFTIEELKTDMSKKDMEDYQDGFNRNYKKIGLTALVVKKYAWWQITIAFVVSGIISFAFYFVWREDVLKEKEEVKKKK